MQHKMSFYEIAQETNAHGVTLQNTQPTDIATPKKEHEVLKHEQSELETPSTVEMLRTLPSQRYLGSC